MTVTLFVTISLHLLPIFRKMKRNVSGGQIPPSRVGLKSPPGDGGISANVRLAQRPINMMLIHSHPNTWVRAIRYAIGSQGVRGREPAVSRKCHYPDVLALATVFAAYCKMAKVWLFGAY